MTMIIEQLTQSWSGDEGDDPAMLLRSRSQFIRAFIERSDQEKQEKRRGWHFVRNVMSILTVHRQMVGESISGATRQVAGHPGAFLSSNGSLLKDFSEQEHTALQRLHADPLGSFAPQFFGVVDHNDRKYIKMQDVLLSMRRPHIMDMKMGTRTFIEEEASNSKLRKDLLQKALKLQKTHPDRVNLLPEELENGITKCRYLTLRDQISTSATLGFRIEGVLMSDGNALECNSLTDKEGVRKILKAFFESASSLQKQTILYRLLALRRTIVKSEFFRWSEVIGSSLLWVYDEVDLEKSGVWMIDFGKTIIARHELTHTRPWELGNQEDGYMVGLNNVILLMEELVDTPTVKEVQTQPDDAVNFRTGSLSEIRYVESSHSLKGNTSTPKVPEFSISSPEHSQYQEIPFISVESPHKEPVSSLRKETSANLSPKSVSFGRNEKPNPNTNERTMITPTTTTPTAPAPSAAIAPSPKPQAPLPLPIPPPAVSNKASSSPSLNENIMELKPCEKVLPRPTHIPPPAISNPQYSPSYNPNIHNANHSPPPSLPGSFINTPTHMPHITIPHPTSPHITRPNESQPSFQTPRANTHLETHMGTWSPQTNSNVSPNITPRPLDPRWISYSLQPYTTQHLINNLTQQQQQQQQQIQNEQQQHHQQQNNQGTSAWNQNNPQPNMTSPLPTVTLPYQHTTTSLLTNGTVISSVYPVHPYHTPYTTTTVISPAMTNYFPSNTSPPPTIITTTTSPLPIHTPPPVPPPQLPTSVSYYTELYQTRSMQRAPSPSPYSEPQLQHISPLKSPLVYHSSNDGERFGLADTKPMYTNRSISPNLVYQSNSPMSLHVIGASSSP